MAYLLHIDNPKPDENTVHSQDDQVIEHRDPPFDGRFDAIIDDINHHMLVFQHIDAHAPKRRKGEQENVELR